MKRFLSLALLAMFLSANSCFAALPEGNMEHLQQSKKIAKKAPTNLVVNSITATTIMQYNVFEATFASNFSTKTAKEGDTVDFLLNDGLKTVEGTTLLPQGTVLSANVLSVIKPKSFNRSGKVTLQFTHFTTPDGRQIPIKAKLFGNKDFLSRGKLNALGKGLGTTLGATAVGVGAGCGIGVACGSVIIGGLAIGLPIGITVGAVAGYVTPGLHYKAKAGDPIVIQFTENVVIAQ